MAQLLKELQKLTDEDLLKIVAEHKEIVYSILYDRYEKRIYYKSLSLLKNKAEAMDLTHDIFIKILTGLSKFEGRSKFSLWVHSISFNTCVKYLSEKKKIVLFDIEAQHDNIVDDAKEDLSEKKLLELNLNLLEHYISLLKEDERIIILMKYMDGLTVREISETTGYKESSIKMKLKRTREILLNMYIKES